MKARMTANTFFILVMVLLSTFSLNAGNTNTADSCNNNQDIIHASAIATSVQSTQKQVLTLNFGSQLNDAELNICNTLGEVVKTVSHINGQEVYIDRSELSNETYYFQLSQSNQLTIIGKLIMQ